LSQSLVEDGLKGPRIDLKQKLSLPDERALLITLLKEVTTNLRDDGGVCESIERANPFPINGHVFLFDLHDLDDRRKAGLRASYMLRPQRTVYNAGDNDTKRSANDDGTFQIPVHGTLRK
jgi:hypothetical protein